jgi:hypothetical protein
MAHCKFSGLEKGNDMSETLERHRKQAKSRTASLNLPPPLSEFSPTGVNDGETHKSDYIINSDGQIF